MRPSKYCIRKIFLHFLECYINSTFAHFIYNLTEAISAYGCPPLVLTTGDKDSMLGENRKLQFQLEKMEIPHTYKEFQSKDDRVMHHVFAIAHPDWPEGMESIRMSI